MSEITVPDDDELLKSEIELDSPSANNLSTWTGGSKTVGLPGIERWYGKVEIADIATESEERAWRAFIYGLRGKLNWFRYVLPCNTHAGNKPTVATGPGNGYTLPLTGLALSQTILLAGQYMTVPLPSGRYRAVCLRSDLVSDGSGNATATFEPALSETPTVGVTVETKDPFVPMRSQIDRHGLSNRQGISGTAIPVMEYP